MLPLTLIPRLMNSNDVQFRFSQQNHLSDADHWVLDNVTIAVFKNGKVIITQVNEYKIMSLLLSLRIAEKKQFNWIMDIVTVAVAVYPRMMR